MWLYAKCFYQGENSFACKYVIGQAAPAICMQIHVWTSADHPSCVHDRPTEIPHFTSDSPQWQVHRLIGKSKRPVCCAFIEVLPNKWHRLYKPSTYQTQHICLNYSLQCCSSFVIFSQNHPRFNVMTLRCQWQIMNSLSQLSGGWTTDCFTPWGVNIFKNVQMEPQATQLCFYLSEKVKFIVISCLIYRVLKNTQIICFPLVLRLHMQNHFSVSNFSQP